MVLFGTYGMFYTAFSPSEITIKWAKGLSVLFFVYFVVATIVFFLKNKQKVIVTFKKKWLFYSYIFVCLPAIFVLLSYIHFVALSKGAPALYTKLFAEKNLIEATITNKRLWGKRDRHEEVFISGFSNSFPVSRQFYDSVTIGESVQLQTMETGLGAKIEFIKP
jgi:hypothetical protein